MIKCYRDASGYCRVDAADMHPLIGSYLEQDVQNSRATCDELKTILNEVSTGTRDEWEGTGNAHTLTIHRDGVTIDNIWDDSLGTANMSIELFRSCVEEWSRCIATISAGE